MDAKFFFAAEPADSSKKAIFKRNFRSFVRASRSVARGHPFCMSDAEGKRTSKKCPPSLALHNPVALRQAT